MLSHGALENQQQLVGGTPASKSSLNNVSTSSHSQPSQGTQKPQPSSSTSSYSGRTSTPKLARSGTLWILFVQFSSISTRINPCGSPRTSKTLFFSTNFVSSYFTKNVLLKCSA
ncbi:hypothetical protein ANCCAN_16495 [Ancylostoma caninum]|uniref:Uncharacterized protein n=1 Tax=Ancylostoma caninum TaxID=29170 RepID=A0A368G3P9_ANCCA|nr:hypothetical protein ANCCAN_16495 [Ancylostoma caninum]